MNYKQLTQEERYQIIWLKGKKLSPTQIAQELNRHPSTIYRELSRNRTKNNAYNYRHADIQSKARRKKTGQNARRLNDEHWSQVKEKLDWQWSPEQISQFVPVSHESIYQYIYRDKQAGGKLYCHLRQKRRYRKRGGRKRRAWSILNAVSIEQRPRIVERRTRLGDIEIDTLIGIGRQWNLLTAVDRASGLLLMKKVKGTKGLNTANTLIDLLMPLKSVIKTITSDNGLEFSEHKTVSQALSCQYYFAHPYSPWERGTNENTNGLIRQYFPKGTDFTNVNEAVIIEVMNRLNHRPRKRLGFKTPYEVFSKKAFALRF